MQVDLRVPDPTTMYKLLIGCVVPRPIAWGSSVDADGVCNLAPFSSFMAITHDPPTIAFSSSPRGVEVLGTPGKKDTLRNIERTRESRVAAAPINMQCRVVQILPVGNLLHHLVIGEIVHLHVRDDVYDPATGRIDMRRLRPVGRLAGHQYTHVHDIFEMKRPAVDYKG